MEPVRDNKNAGQGRLCVGEDTCLISLSEDCGHFWETIWNHPDNDDLKQARGDARVLLKGDRLTIPPIEPKRESAAVEQKHRYRRKGVPAKFRLQVYEEGEAVAGAPWKADLGNATHEGETDGDGVLEFPIPNGATTATIDVETPKGKRRFKAKLGAMDPPDTVRGAQKRLSNLGFGPLRATGRLDDQTRGAISKFQALNDIDPTGDLDQKTVDALHEQHVS